MGKIINKPGIIRRPIEYVLLAMLAVLTVFCFWVYIYLGNLEGNDSLPVALPEDDGSVTGVSKIIEENIRREKSMYQSFDSYFDTTADAAVDNVAGVYDETEL